MVQGIGTDRLSVRNLLSSVAGRGLAALLAAFGPPRGGGPLGAVVATSGPRARAVFAASRYVARRPGPGVDLVVADTPETAGEPGIPSVILSQAPPGLAVPALDPAVDNPAGWLRDAGGGAGTLGRSARLPDGTRARRVSARNGRALRRFHHLEDVAAHHPGPVARAGVLVRLAARGVPVRLADADERLAPLLGDELWSLMNAGMRDLDPGEREHLSVRLRRAALRGHSLRARARAFCELALPDPPRLPLVSVLFVPRRATDLSRAADSVAGQSYPRLELVLVLRDGEAADAEGERARFPFPVKAVRVGAELPPGSALNAGVRSASGTLVARMDDEGVYHPDHLWDLVLAMEYARTDIVGKGEEFVYFPEGDRTVHRLRGTGERYVTHVADGAFMVARAALGRAGGWPRVADDPDAELQRNLVGLGGSVYRTHGSGFLRIRRGDGRARETDDARAGWAPAFAGLPEDLGPPRPDA